MSVTTQQPPVDTTLAGPRVQLALNVDDLDEAVRFYSRLFRAEPHKRRPGYANFAITEPPLKLVLIENPGHGGSLNHLGVEVGTTDEVADATRRLTEAGLASAVEDATTCCFAVQDKVWATAPGGERWEVYTILDDNPETMATDEHGCTPGGECCTGDDCC
jgi:catechol 2,3-dioxygenase-like lactoylglutathione lyase family enzyme